MANTTMDSKKQKPEIGCLWMNRGEETKILMDEYPKEFMLLNMIAYRARLKPTAYPCKLETGEAFIGKGDFERYGWSEANYRTAKKRLKKWGFIDTRITNKGTIAKILNTRIFDIDAE